MSALLPCPWCGERPIAPPDSAAVFCGSPACDVRSHASAMSRDAAIAAWNRRTPPPLPTREEVARVMFMREWPTPDRLEPEQFFVDCKRVRSIQWEFALMDADAVLRLLGGERDNG